jgi:hypothetical protein
VLRRPEVAHRLDAETGGLVICGKTTATLQALSSAFATQRIIKRYRALVRGGLQGCGRITLPISGAASETEYRSVAVHRSSKCMHLTVVDLWPRTGRTHQLRKHMAYLGHPILGDQKYWGTRKLPKSVLSGRVTVLEECQLASADLEAAVRCGGDVATQYAEPASVAQQPADHTHDSCIETSAPELCAAERPVAELSWDDNQNPGNENGSAVALPTSEASGGEQNEVCISCLCAKRVCLILLLHKNYTSMLEKVNVERMLQ